MRLPLALCAFGLIALAGCGSNGKTSSSANAAAKTKTAATRAAPAGPLKVTVKAVGHLPSPTQDPATTGLPSGDAILFGGLNQADVSVSAIVGIANNKAATVGNLPGAMHDMAATSVGAHAYTFGGGNLGSSDAILKDGKTKVATLPVAASDVTATTLNGTAYIVGGFDGTNPLNTIVAWRPGTKPRVVAHMPRPIRYAAVAAVGNHVLIAGGTSGVTARDEILTFDPTTAKVKTIGHLPSPVTHAAGATLGGRFLVIGGRRGTLNSQTDQILNVDPARGSTTTAGHLPHALSDTGSATLGSHVLVVGGRNSTGTVSAAIYSVSPKKRTTVRVVKGLAGVTGTAATRTGRKIDAYAADHVGNMSAAVAGDPARVYVPNSGSDTVDVIDQHTFKVIKHFSVGHQPQHVTPSWDLKTLWVSNDLGNSLTAISARTSKPIKTVKVRDPYNLYFTPNGQRAIVVAEALHRLDFRSPHTMTLLKSVPIKCSGIDHMDYTLDGTKALASCEFSGELALVDLRAEKILRYIPLKSSAMPQDVKLAPDGQHFFVADMASNGVWIVDAATYARHFEPTGKGAHGIYVSRDSKDLYVSNRGEGTISVLDANTGQKLHKWHLSGGGSPDMGGVSADGRILWLSGRYNSVVYAIDTRSGRLLHKIPVGSGPHGLSVWPQPGRYSIGHTGIMR